MPSSNFYFDTILDETLFSVREMEHDDLYHITPESSPGWAMQELDGCQIFQMQPTDIAKAQKETGDRQLAEQGRVYATLRVDSKNRIISGDLFHDIRRRNWICSWRSEAIIAPANPIQASDWHLLCIAEMFYPNGEDQRYAPPEKMTIMLKCGPNQALKGCRILALNSSGLALRDLTMTEPNKPERADTFRELTLVTVVDEKLKEYGLQAVVESALGMNDEAVSDLLRASRVSFKRGTGNSVEKIVQVSSSGRNDPDSSPPYKTAFEMLAPYQWSDDPHAYAVLLTAIVPPRKDLYGTALGLDGSALRHKSRFGAVVYVRNIVDRYREWQEAKGEQVDDNEIARRIRHTYIHELGHLLNLPHPWHRDLFLSPPLDANPAAKTWMNYGSRYPLGDLMVASRKWAVTGKADKECEEEKLEIMDSEKSGAGALRNPGFSEPEHRWFWHAPFDQIATGGEYFTDTGGTPMQLGKASEVLGTLELKIHDAEPKDDNKAQDDARAQDEAEARDDAKKQKKGVLELRKTPGDRMHLQPFIGEVTFEPRPGLMTEHPFHFTFQSPMLSLLVRAEYPRDKDRNFPRQTLEVPVSMLPIQWKFKDAIKQKDMHLAAVLHAHALKPAPNENGEPPTKFRKSTPLVTPRFLRKFREKPDHFTLQAVLRPYRCDPIYSKQVRIRFVGGPGRYSGEEEAILGHKRLPLLLELLSYKPVHPIETLLLPGQHSGKFDDPVFLDLVERIKSVNPGPLSKELFAIARICSGCS